MWEQVTDTLWADISSYQGYVDFTKYPYRVLCIRSNDGTYDDPHFQQNLALARLALAAGHLDMLGVYYVFEPNWQDTVGNLEANVGPPHPRMFFMGDAEKWGNRIRGDQSAGILGSAYAVGDWCNAKLGIRNGRDRSVIYGNMGDLAELLPVAKRPAPYTPANPHGLKIVLADYTGNPPYLGKWAHQYANNFTVPPFGPCDINSADGRSVPQLAAELGINLSPPAPPKPPVTPSTGDDLLDFAYFIAYGQQRGRWNATQHAYLVKDVGPGLVAGLRKEGL